MEERKISLKDMEKASRSMQRLAQMIYDYDRRGSFTTTIVCSYSLTSTKIIETISSYGLIEFSLDYKMTSKIRGSNKVIGEYCLLQSVADYFNAVVLFFNKKEYSESDSDNMVEYQVHILDCSGKVKDFIGQDCTIGYISTVNDGINALAFEQNIARQVFNAEITQLGKDNLAGISHNEPSWYFSSDRIGKYQERTDLRNTGKGCYVATAVYGSYDCPEVWTLRRFRDYYLANSLLGRAFIRIYYATSPTLVKLFGSTAWFKRFWKQKLDKLVTSLKQRGYDDSPYDD